MIKTVKTTQDIRSFALLGVEFSKSYPNGIPKFQSSELNNFNPKHNYFLRIGGKLQAFLSDENGSLNGRIAAMIHPEQPTNGLIGLFDCVENEMVAHNLIDVAIEWLIENGCKSIIAPVDFSIFRSYRFMTNGFEEKSFVGEPRNPSYYPQFFQNYGFVVKHQWDSRYIDKTGMQTFLNDNKPHADCLDQLGYTIEKFNDKNKHDLMKKTYQIMIQGYKVFPLFTHLSEEDFMREYDLLPDMIHRESSLFVYNPKHEFLGFFLVFKDLTIPIQQMNGKSNIIAKLRFLLNQHKTEMANVAQGATTPYFIREAAVLGKRELNKSFSLASAISYKAIKLIDECKDYNSAIFTLIRDEGQMRNHVVKPTKIRNYSLFEFELKLSVDKENKQLI